MSSPRDPLWKIFEPLVLVLRDNIFMRLKNMATVKQNVNEMTNSMEDLKARRTSVEKEIKDGRRKGMQCTPEAARWLREVGEVDRDVIRVKGQFENRGCFLLEDCSMNCCLSLRIGEDAANLHKRLEDLKTKVDNLDRVRRSGPEPILELSFSSRVVESATMKSHEHMVHGYLRDDNVRMVGIWGMGGVGKTTLLMKINNSFLEEENWVFDYVIYVAANRTDTVKSLQSDLATRLELDLPSPDNVQSVAASISRFLNQINFLLLIDDLWEAIDLTSVGIPVFSSSNHKQKVVIATRFEGVCARMNITTTRIRVQCLEQNEAMDLLRETVGTELIDNHPALHPLAEKVAKKCSQLPRAIVCIGQALSTMRTHHEWSEMLKAITKPQPTRSSPFRDMEDKILPTLKLTYDNLRNDRVRECFLCCSFWPDERIDINDLIECWIGLGLIGGFADIEEAYAQGHTIIGRLKEACLLEHDDADEDKFVKMCNVVRQLALWIVSNHEDYKGRWHVKANFGLKSVFEFKSVEISWDLAKLVSLMENKIVAVGNFGDASEQNPTCPPLSTFILRQNQLLKSIYYGFFRYATKITYLDLSHSNISWLPRDIECLTELQHLDLSHTPIASLPDALRNLRKLKYLLLRHMRRLKTVPMELISELSSLEVLYVFPNTEIDRKGFWWLTRLKAVSMAVRSPDTLQELKGVAMRNLGIYDMKESSHLKIDHSSFQQSCLEKLQIESCLSLEKLEIEPEEELSRLAEFYLWNLWNLQEISFVHAVPSTCLRSLSAMEIQHCNKLRNISWVKQLPCLVKLYLKYCSMVETIAEVEKNEMDLAFKSLKDLRLEGLPVFHSICNETLAFPFLESIVVFNCPLLNKLPFKSQIANNKKLRKIGGSREWFEGLEWEDGTKASFLPYFWPL